MPEFNSNPTHLDPYFINLNMALTHNNGNYSTKAAIGKNSSEATDPKIIKYTLKNVCLSGDTEVYIEGGGIKEIQHIGVGQKVLSRCEITGEIAYRKVIKTFEHEDVPCFHVIYSAYRERYPQGTKKSSPLGAVIATAEHPFWVKGKGWTAVRDLQPGDELMSCDDTLVIIEEIKPLDECNVYNLHVEEFHTYFVGGDAILVHDQNLQS